jgi:hypothetical protein
VPPALGAAVLRALAPTPVDRYATAADMEHALRDGLRGRAPAELDPTVALGGMDATRVLHDATSATSVLGREPRREPLQPLPEPPRPAAPARGEAPVAAKPSRRRRAAPSAPVRDAPPGRWRGLKLFVWLIVVLALVAGGLAAYQEFGPDARRAIDAGREITGDVQTAVDQLRDVIERNTR